MSVAEQFLRLANQLPSEERAYILAELNDLLATVSASQIDSLSEPSIADPYLANYVAAMVEQAAHLSDTQPPQWTSRVVPLAQPVFATPWPSLRTHLLLESPIPFRRRNIFIDATIGDRV